MRFIAEVRAKQQEMINNMFEQNARLQLKLQELLQVVIRQQFQMLLKNMVVQVGQQGEI